MDNWGEDNEGNDESDDEEIDDDDDNNYDDEDDSEDNESDEEESDEDDGVEDEIFLDKFIRTFHNGDYDADIDEKLSLDRGELSLPVRPTQASYNKTDNWRERNRIGLEKVQGQLQRCIDHTSHDASFNLDLRHNNRWYQLRDNEEPIVWHESILVEYWNNFDAEIDRRKQQELITDISRISIENVEIKKERLAALVAIILDGSVDISSAYVRFINAHLCGEGIVQLSKLVVASSNLKEFCLHHNRIDNMESARCLSRSLKLHTRINYLD